MNDVTVHCDTCGKELGKAIGDEFHPMPRTHRNNQPVVDIELPWPLERMAEVHDYFRCYGQRSRGKNCSALIDHREIAEKVRVAREKGRTSVTVPRMTPPADVIS